VLKNRSFFPESHLRLPDEVPQAGRKRHPAGDPPGVDKPLNPPLPEVKVECKTFTRQNDPDLAIRPTNGAAACGTGGNFGLTPICNLDHNPALRAGRTPNRQRRRREEFPSGRHTALDGEHNQIQGQEKPQRKTIPREANRLRERGATRLTTATKDEVNKTRHPKGRSTPVLLRHVRASTPYPKGPPGGRKKKKKPGNVAKRAENLTSTQLLLQNRPDNPAVSAVKGVAPQPNFVHRGGGPWTDLLNATKNVKKTGGEDHVISGGTLIDPTGCEQVGGEKKTREMVTWKGPPGTTLAHPTAV